MKTRIILIALFAIFAARVFSQPVPQKAPADPNYKITNQEFEEMKANGIILPPIKPAFDPWKNFRPNNTRTFDPIYDMRTTGWLTSVKSQTAGACWAYSTMGAVESRWKMLGLGTYDLSDNNLKWCHKYIPSRSTYGNHWMSSAYFARRSGPFLESEYPAPGSPDNCPDNLSAVYYIHQSRYPPFNMNAIKQSVLDYGPVWSLLYIADAYYNASNYTYYYGGTASVNHAGCVVGWDDTKVTAGGTGAWIVKNTYGTGWGQQGYYYISYNDSQFLRYNGYWPEMMENEANTTIHQYDEIGGYWGVGFNSEVGYGLVKFQNTEHNQEITKVGTFLLSTGCGVEIKIYDSFNGTVSGLLGSKDETISGLPGYYTIDLDSAIFIPAGEDFYVQIKYDSNDPTDFWPISIEDTITGYAQPEIETGKYWIAPNPQLWPTYWYQVGKNTAYHYDLCIKAYANILPDPIASAGDNDTIAEDESFLLSGAAAENYGELFWTGGDGTFDNPNILKPEYFPGVADITAGTVELCLNAQSIYPNTLEDEDCMTLKINHYPLITITSPADAEKFCEPLIVVTGTASDPDTDLDMVEVRLNAGLWQTAQGTENWSVDLTLEQGINTIEARAKDAGNLVSDTSEINLNLNIQNIPLLLGWSAISSFLEPDDPNVVNVMQDVVSNLVILLGKTGIYAPAPYNVNTIVNWDSNRGYKIKMSNADLLSFCGDTLSGNTVNFDAGFNFIPVHTNVNAPISGIFSNPATDILYIYDLATTKIYWPDGGIYNLQFLLPGVGYMAYFINPVTITFPAFVAPFSENKATAQIPASGPWPCIANFNVHLISIDKNAISPDEANFIGAFDNNGHCIGFTEITETNENYLLAVYGDDEFTTLKDGANAGEIFSFKMHSKTAQMDEELFAVYDPSMPQNDAKFTVNGLSKITSFYKESAGFNERVTPEMIRVFPQPASEMITIIYPFNPENLNLQLLSMDGKILKTGIINSRQTELNVGNLAPGVYILKIHDSENLILKKVVIE
jgi:C1A family cysteine protease